MVDLDAYFAELQPGTKVTYSKSDYPNLLHGFEETIWAEPRWGLPPQLRRGKLHAVDYGDQCEIHLDRWNPLTHPWEHLRDDAPHLLAVIVTLGFTGGMLALNWIRKKLKQSGGNS